MLLIFFHVLFIGSAVFIYLWKFCKKEYKKSFIVALILKIGCGLLLGYLYMHYFDGGDSAVYMNEAERIQIAHVHPIELLLGQKTEVFDQSVFKNQPRALLFTKIVYLLYFITNGNFWLISTYLTLLSFIGFWTFYLVLSKESIVSQTVLFVSLFIWPSVVFWSSGLIKESLSVGLIMLIAATTFSFNYHGRYVWKVIVFVFLSYMLFKIKYYYAGIIIPIAIGYSSTRYFQNKFRKINQNLFWQLITFFGITIALGLIASRFHYNLHLHYILKIIVTNYELFAEKSQPGKFIVFNDLMPTVSSFLQYLPKALVAGLFRPSIFDAMNFWSLIAALENTCIAVFAILQLRNFKMLHKGDVPLKYAVLLICLLMAIFLSFSAPNFGTLVRYKAGFIPFLILLLLAGNPFILRIKKAGFIPGFKI